MIFYFGGLDPKRYTLDSLKCQNSNSSSKGYNSKSLLAINIVRATMRGVGLQSKAKRRGIVFS